MAAQGPGRAQKQRGKIGGARFAEVTVQSSAVTEDRIEIVLGDPIRVEVDCGVAVEQVASLVKALRESGC